MSTNMRNMRELAMNAIQVQDASNLAGVVLAFASDILRLRELLTEQDGPIFCTERVNRHPICVLWSSKIAALTGSESASEFNIAYHTVSNMAYNPDPL